MATLRWFIVSSGPAWEGDLTRVNRRCGGGQYLWGAVGQRGDWGAGLAIPSNKKRMTY